MDPRHSRRPAGAPSRGGGQVAHRPLLSGRDLSRPAADHRRRRQEAMNGLVSLLLFAERPRERAAVKRQPTPSTRTTVKQSTTSPVTFIGSFGPQNQKSATMAHHR